MRKGVQSNNNMNRWLCLDLSDCLQHQRAAPGHPSGLQASPLPRHGWWHQGRYLWRLPWFVEYEKESKRKEGKRENIPHPLSFYLFLLSLLLAFPCQLLIFSQLGCALPTTTTVQSCCTRLSPELAQMRYFLPLLPLSLTPPSFPHSLSLLPLPFPLLYLFLPFINIFP